MAVQLATVLQNSTFLIKGFQIEIDSDLETK